MTPGCNFVHRLRRVGLDCGGRRTTTYFMASEPLNRRELIRIGGLVGSAVAAGLPSAAWAGAAPQVPRRQLGKTKKRVPILMMGGSMRIDIPFDVKFAEAFKHGVNYFDTSRIYVGGNGEVALANFHRRLKCRDRMWITTKSKRHEPDAMAASLEESLQKLKSDHVELFFLHALTKVDRLSPLLAKRVDALKKAGKIHHFGFSTHNANVVELLEKAAETPWVDVVMFRYNFRQYGDVALNRAIEKAAAAGVGLIAMKTQGVHLDLHRAGAAANQPSPDDKWKSIAKSGRWNKYQASLKAVWADERITGCVSEMDTLDKVRQNVAAALDQGKLGALDAAAIRKFADATRNQACDGCDQHCSRAVNAPVRIADTLRMLGYHDAYGKPEEARALFAELPQAARQLHGVDFSGANLACPHGVDVAAHMRRAAKVLSA